MMTGDSASITGVAEPEQVMVQFVTDGMIPVLGIQPMLGRGFTKQDDTPNNPDTVKGPISPVKIGG